MSDEAPQGSPHRSATRAPVNLPVGLRFDDSTELVEARCSNISIGGMFVSDVDVSRPSGTLAGFELQLEESSIRGVAEVVWMRPSSGQMGLKFRYLEQRDRQQIFKLVSQHIKDRLTERHPPIEEPPTLAETLAAERAAAGSTVAPPPPIAERPSPWVDPEPPPLQVDAPDASAVDDAAFGGAALPDEADEADEARTALFEPGASQRPAMVDDEAVGPSSVRPAADEMLPLDPIWSDATADDGLTDQAPVVERRAVPTGSGNRRVLMLAAAAALVLAALLFLTRGWIFPGDASPPAADEVADETVTNAAATGAPQDGPPTVTTTPAEVVDADDDSRTTESSDTRVVAPAPTPPAATAASPATPPAAPSRAASFARVTGVTSRVPDAGTQIVRIETDGSVPGDRYDHFRLDGGSGPREVVRLFGLRARFDRPVVALDGPAVRQVRTGWHADRGRGNELHVVLDLGDAAWRVTRLEPTAGGLDIVVER